MLPSIPRRQRSNDPYERLPGDEESQEHVQLTNRDSNPHPNTNNTSNGAGTTTGTSQSVSVSASQVPEVLSNDVTAETPSSATNGNGTNLNTTANPQQQQQQQQQLLPSAVHTDTEHSDSEADDNTETDMMMDLDPQSSLHSLLVEREYHRRGSSGCFIILSLVLLRLWTEALFEGDLTLMLISFFMTMYLVAWRRNRRGIEESLNAQILALQRGETEGGGVTGQGTDEEHRTEGDEHGNGNGNGGGSTRRSRRRFARRMRNNNPDAFDLMGMRNNDHIDLEMLGFQAQLAFAIMESQRHIIETGGYGRPDDEDDNDANRGVSEETKSSWTSFEYDVNDIKVRECADLKPHKNEDPSCCICLCEYESGENLTQLACGHVYHKECIESWCENHIRCPLCNLNLEEDEEIV